MTSTSASRKKPMSTGFNPSATLPFAVESVTPIDPLVMEKHHIVAHRTLNQAADRFRILRARVLHSMTEAGARTLGITSPNYGDGKTTIALNLAISIAHDLNQTVLLVDLDLRKPNVTDYLGLTASHGLTDHFLHDLPIAECLMRTSFPRLSILPAGAPLPHSSEILGSPKIAQLAQELKARYADRLIIYDLPPILAQDDPLVFAPHIDGTLLVIKEGETRVEDVKSCLHTLNRTHVIGTVLNYSEDRAQTDARRLKRAK